MILSPRKAIENQSITRRLAATLIITVLIVSAIAITAMHYVVTQSATRNLEQKADETLAYLVGTLEMPLWTVDDNEIKTIGVAVSHDESIVRLVIRNESGAVIHSIEKAKGDDLVGRSGKIFHKQQNLENLVGEVSVFLSPAIARAGNRQLLIFSTLIIFLILIAVVIVTVIFIRTSLNKPLTSLNEMAERFASGNYDTSAHPLPYLEFQPFGRALAQMATKIAGQIRMIQEAEAKYRDIFENAIEGIFQSSVDGRLLHSNPALARIFGYAALGEFLASAADIPNNLYVNPEDRDRLLSLLLERGAVSGYEVRFRRKDQQVIWVSMSARMVRDEAGSPLLIEGFLADISDHKQAEEALRESEAKYRRIVDTATEGIWMLGPDNMTSFVNARMAEMLGYSGAEMVGRPATDFMFAADVPDHQGRMASRRQGRSESYERRFRRKDGQTVWALASATPVFDDEHHFKGSFAMLSDITERKQAEKELRESETLYRSLVNAMAEGICLQTANGEVTAVNPAAERIQGRSSAQMLGANSAAPQWGAICEDGSPFPGERHPAMLTLRSGEPQTDVVMGIHKPDGSLVWISINSQPLIADGESTPYAVVTTFHDITGQKLAAESLRCLNRELRAISSCNQTLMRAEDEQTLLNDICRIVCDEAGYRMAWVGYAEHDEARTIRPVAWAGVENGYLEQAALSWADTEQGGDPSGTAIRSGASVCVQDFTNGSQAARWRKDALQRGYRSGIALPLKDEHARVFGVFLIYSAEINAITPAEIRLLEELSGDLAFGITALRTRAEHRRMEALLVQREYEFRTLAENSPDVIVRYDREGRRIYVNPEFERVNHLAAKEVLGKNPLELSVELAPVAAVFMEKLMAAMASGTPDKIDLAWSKDDKPICWFVRLVPEFDADGQVASALTIWSDISERKRAEEEIRQLNAELEQRVAERTRALVASEERFRNIYDTAPVSIWHEDWTEVIAAVRNLRAEGVTDFAAYFREHPEFVTRAVNAVKILDVNHWTLGMFAARNKAEMLASLGTVFATPDTLGGFVGELIALAEGQTLSRTEMALNTVSGDLIHTLVTLSFPPPGSELTGVLVSLINISERKAAEEALRASEERMRLFFERQLVGMAITSPEKGWVQVNDKTCEMLGYSSAELAQLNWADLTYPDDLAADVAQFERLLSGEIDSYALEKRFVRKDGSIVFTNLAVGCVRRANRSVDYVLALLEDITERKHAEERIQKLNEELRQRALMLEAANKELESFSYSVSHDLRAPLRHIDGFLGLLKERTGAALDEESQHYMATISDAARRMGILIDDLLSFARMGRKEMTRIEVDLGALIQDVIREFDPETAGRNIRWRIAELPVVAGDRAMLRIALVNLLSNALKFTRPRAQAEIEIGCLPGDEGDTIVFVRDNGVGFDMKYVDKLFGVFQRLHGADEFEGTGIGLANVRRVIDRHGGRAWAEGAVDGGATFYFSLPDKGAR